MGDCRERNHGSGISDGLLGASSPGFSPERDRRGEGDAVLAGGAGDRFTAGGDGGDGGVGVVLAGMGMEMDPERRERVEKWRKRRRSSLR